MKKSIYHLLKKYRDILIISAICLPLGAVIGAIDAVFGRVLLAITAFRDQHPIQLIPFLALGGAFVAFCYSKYGKGTEKGMSLVFNAAGGKAESIPLRLIPFIISGTWITHLFGGSAGREGVAVQIGGTLSHWVGSRIPLKNSRRIFLISGMAAGFAGLFRTPIAAVFFALEVLVAGEVCYSALLPSLVASYTASTISGLLGLGKFTHLLGDSVTLNTALGCKLLVAGIVFGITGGCFAALLSWTKKKFSALLSNPVKRIAIISVMLSIILLILHKGRYAGLGTNLINLSFNSGHIYSYDWLIKILLTTITLAAGFQGGEVTPLFSIGSSLGIVLGELMGMPLEFTAALGYSAVFAGASNTFITPVLIGAEVFGFDYLPYFFIVCCAAYVFNGDKSIYGKQKLLHFSDME